MDEETKRPRDSSVHILLIGASGSVGKLVLEQALSRGHAVTALVRNPDSLDYVRGKPASENLTVLQGTPLNKDDLQKAISHIKTHPRPAVIVTLNNTAKSAQDPPPPGQCPPHLQYDVHKLLLPLMSQHQINKLVVLQALGVGSSWPNLALPIRLAVKYTSVHFSWDDHADVDRFVKAYGDDNDVQGHIKWVLVRSCMFSNGPAKEAHCYGEDGVGLPWFPSISRASVAKFLLDSCENDVWDNKTPVVANNAPKR
ncbi:NAD(P)-binding protein [Pseudovirgaria hyperparasitica]|uniref:NAD(P)-binding protein n=1 Tax=Pseudovirgaria hyperparasitica TaxID=470096 RepID=A0A6A6W292_9PEZI|nr:NAD(P)-binding protein [Pseudovirgaria hyperparasitica]KAF2756229.1 NAD(P)-binding protein [Pseudovirgaria hyperparasitica]